MLGSIDEINLLNLPRHLHGKMMAIILHALRHDGMVYSSDFSKSYRNVLTSLIEYGLLQRLNLGQYKLNMELLKQVSYVVPDEVFLKFADDEYCYEVKRKAGMYNLPYEQQKEKWRKRDAERRERRKAAKREKLPSNDMLNMSDIIIKGSFKDVQKG